MRLLFGDVGHLTRACTQGGAVLGVRDIETLDLLSEPPYEEDIVGFQRQSENEIQGLLYSIIDIVPLSQFPHRYFGAVGLFRTSSYGLVDRESQYKCECHVFVEDFADCLLSLHFCHCSEHYSN